MTNDKKLFNEKAQRRAAEVLRANPSMERSAALNLAIQELTSYKVAVPDKQIAVYRQSKDGAAAAQKVLELGGFTGIAVTEPEFSPSVLQP